MANFATVAVVTLLASYISLSEVSVFVEALAKLILAFVAVYKVYQYVRRDVPNDAHEFNDSD